MPKFNPIDSTKLSGCMAATLCSEGVKDDGPDFLKFLRRIAAERLTDDPNKLSLKAADAFIAKYENKIPGARKNHILENREIVSLFKILAKELAADKKRIFTNARSLQQPDIDRAHYLGTEIAECNRFAKKLA